jgi:hypothetical protein
VVQNRLIHTTYTPHRWPPSSAVDRYICNSKYEMLMSVVFTPYKIKDAALSVATDFIILSCFVGGEPGTPSD